MNVGDVVYLKSGGQPMTVIALRENNMAQVNWLSGSMQGAVLPEACLVSDDPGPAIRDASRKTQEAIDAATKPVEPAQPV